MSIKTFLYPTTSASTADLGWTTVRVIAGLILTYYGAQKLFGAFGGNGFQGTVQYMTSTGIPAPLAVLAIIAEFFGGLGLAVGFLSRIAALGVFSTMMVATSVHLKGIGGVAGFGVGKIPDVNLVFFPFLIGIVALGVIISGAGRLSLDAKVFGPKDTNQ